MASNRHLGRIIVLQTLYEHEFRREAGDPSASLEGILARNISRYNAFVEDQDFIRRLTLGVAGDEAKLDATLQPLAPEWPIDQIARMDRTVLHMGLYELQSSGDVPPKVVINEAVELAKAFGGDNSSKFVNGVLGTYYRQHIEPKDASSSSKAPVAEKPAKKAKS
jgi:N utilization substance protein B